MFRSLDLKKDNMNLQSFGGGLISKGKISVNNSRYYFLRVYKIYIYF